MCFETKMKVRMKKAIPNVMQNKKNLPSFLRLGGGSGVSLWVCRSLPVSTNNGTKSVPRLEENLQTVDAGDADIADGADFVGAEELDSARS